MTDDERRRSFFFAGRVRGARPILLVAGIGQKRYPNPVSTSQSVVSTSSGGSAS